MPHHDNCTHTHTHLTLHHCVCAPVSSEMQADPFSGLKEKTHLVPVLTLTPEKTLGLQKINVTYYNIFAGNNRSTLWA